MSTDRNDPERYALTRSRRNGVPVLLVIDRMTGREVDYVTDDYARLELPSLDRPADFDFTTSTPEGVTYSPWTDGYAVGFKCEHANGTTEYIYLNPSSDSDDGQPNVFLYHGTYGNPALDGAHHHYNVLEDA